METQRLLLFIALALISLMIWQTWEREHNPQLEKAPSATSENKKIPAVSQDDTNDNLPVVIDNTSQDNKTDVPIMQTKSLDGKNIKVITNLLELSIDTNGAHISQVKLLDYPIDVEHKDQPFALLDNKAPFFIAQTGIKGLSSLDKKLFPNHNAKFTSQMSEYMLGSQAELRVPFVWQDAPTGLSVIKTYIFEKDSYEIKVEYQIKNNTGADWIGSAYGQLQREGLQASEERGLTNYSYTGGVYYTKDNAYTKVDFEELGESDLNISSVQSWVGFIQHYFAAAVLPKAKEKAIIYSYRPGDKYAIGTLLPSLTIKNGETSNLGLKFFIGPKLQDKMDAAAKGLGLTVDYGWLTFIAKPLFWLLDKIHGVVQNWGLAIILITVLIKLVFYKLSETSYRSMARMRKLQPRLKQLKERFGDDKTKMNEAMMKMYREEKVNPMGGCLPILVQMPVFIALYWMLMESVELRQASFLWLEDLSIKDPYFILPVIMGVSMLIQQKLNPAPVDPMQAKIMMALPLVFTVFFAFFPSGLVLYWVVNNIISIAQQWVITKRIAG